MGAKKTKRKADLKTKRNNRWSGVKIYLSANPCGEHRCFYARTIKHLLVESDWDNALRAPCPDEHNNMREMLVSFNDQRSDRMRERGNDDVSLERKVIGVLKKNGKKRVRKKNARRFTAEMMKLIREHFPAEFGERDRVTKMSQFVKELVEEYLQD